MEKPPRCVAGRLFSFLSCYKGCPGLLTRRPALPVRIDLLVVPTHGRTGLRHFLQTSIAETVATHAFPPVLTFKLAPAGQ